MSRPPRRIVPFALCFLALATFTPRALAQQLPPLPDGTMVALQVDLTRLDLAGLGAAAKMAIPPEAAAIVAQVNQKVQEAVKAGVTTVTAVLTLADVTTEGSPT